MKLYHLDDAFQDVSRETLGDDEQLDYDRRWRAALLLHAIVRAGLTAGLPDDPAAWPGGHPVTAVVFWMNGAGEPLTHDDAADPSACSPWALREVAAELRAGSHVNGDEDLYDQAGQLDDHAEGIETGRDIPAEDELEGYDGVLLAVILLNEDGSR